MNENSFETEIDLKMIFQLLWNKKLFISIIVSIAAIFSVLYALSLPNIYTSKILLAPTDNDNSLTANMGSLSTLASIGGFNLQNENASKTQEAIERIKSFDFFSSYFLPNIKLENIMAVKRWDSANNALIYDEAIFDKDSGKWIKISDDLNPIPSHQEAFKRYNDILNISENTATSFVSLSINHESPFIAKKWVEIIVVNINESMREQDKESAQRSIDFLEMQASSVNIQTIKDAISNLLESQIQVLMMASSNDAYVFKVLDSPFVPEEKSKPSRALICILGTILGIFFSTTFVIIRHYYFLENNNTF